MEAMEKTFTNLLRHFQFGISSLNSLNYSQPQDLDQLLTAIATTLIKFLSCNDRLLQQYTTKNKQTNKQTKNRKWCALWLLRVEIATAGLYYLYCQNY